MRVVDASVGFKMLVAENDSGKALALLSDDLHAPEFYAVELTNALRMDATFTPSHDASFDD